MTTPVPLRRRSGPLTAIVTAVENPTPQLRRVHLRCPELGMSRPLVPGTWLRGYFPDAGPTNPDNAGQPSLAARAYTICQFDPADGSFFVDFVLHGHGPAARWAANAEPGANLLVNGHLGCSGTGPKWQRYVFIGDATALPAIREMLGALPPGDQARAHIWLPDETERQDFPPAANVTVTWHTGGLDIDQAGDLFTDGWDVADPSLRVWIAGEAGQAARTRRTLEVLPFAPGSLHVAGYWRAGQASGDSPIH